MSCPLLNPPMSAFSSTNLKICKTQQFLLYSSQVVIFVKSVARCVALSQLLVEQNFPAIAIHRGMAQEERLVLRHFRKKSVFFFFFKVCHIFCYCHVRLSSLCTFFPRLKCL